MAWTLLNEFIHGDCMEYMREMPDNLRRKGAV